MEQVRRIRYACRMILAMVLLFTSCIEHEIEHVNVTSKEVQVKITLQMPQAAPRTYAISEEDENYVTTIDVLAFKYEGEKWVYDYSAEGTSISDAGGGSYPKKQFTVTLVKNNYQQKIVILANVRDEITALGQITKGVDRDALLKDLISNTTGKWDANDGKSENDMDKTFAPFPMWGEVGTTIADNTVEISNIIMLRSIARIDIVLGNNVNNFKLNNIYIYNSKNKGHIVPASSKISNGTVTAATIPDGNINNTTVLMYTVPEAMDKAFERSIYLYEAEAVAQNQPAQATAIVVGGTYGEDSDPSYYRLDFLKNDKKTYKDILRNHKYCFNITNVYGRGYSSPDKAFEAKPFNMEVETPEWDDGDIGYIVFDGQYMLGVSQPEFIFNKEAKDNNQFAIITDVPGGWSITGISESNIPGSAADWITISPPHSGNTGVKTYVNFNVKENSTGKIRTAHVHITAGHLSLSIQITQNITSGIRL